MNNRPSRFDSRRQGVHHARLRWACAITLTLILLALSGCRGKAYRDVYQQKMIGEIRNLEDQLYEADYQNRILIDELSRARSQVAVPNAKRSRSTTDSSSRSGPSELSGPGFSSPGANGQPQDSARPRPTLPARPIPLDDDQDAQQIPPLIPIPPGKENELPEIELGEPVPPSGLGAPPELPPGRIEFPQSTRRMVREAPAVPVAIRVNPSLSGGYRFDDSPRKTGMHLAIEAIDQHGERVRLEDFDLAGDLSIVLTDPSQPPDKARLGQWDYDADEVRQMIRPGLASAIHVYVPWEENVPAGKQVVAQVVLASDESQMQTRAELKTAEIQPAVWNPRGGSGLVVPAAGR